MMTITEKIQSIRETVNGSYSKPSPERVQTLTNALTQNSAALDYLKVQRGFTDETIQHFKLGYDSEKNAISIPIFKRNECINIKYRLLDPEARSKYIAEKNCEVWIFNEEGIDVGRGKGGILVTEGEFDAMSAWQAGFKNVVSPASGKNSYGVWLELLDTIPKVYIAYDNDKPGKTTALEMAERVGTEKSLEIKYPEGIKDANEFFKVHSSDEFKDLIRQAVPFYKYKFQGMKELIDSLRTRKDDVLRLDCVPFLEFEEDWLTLFSGVSNVGKSSYAMNIANELVDKDIPVLVLPFERGIRTVGKRFIQVRYDKEQSALEAFGDDDWDLLVNDAMSLPLYFSVPRREEIKEIVAKAKRIFGVKVIIIDHLDYLVRKSSDNHNVETSNTLQEFKSLAQEHGIIFIVIHHIKKQEGVGSVPRKPKMEDLKGSSSTYQDPEAVVMLSSPEKGQLEVDIVKNKGTMGSRIFKFNQATGKIGKDITDSVVTTSVEDKWKDIKENGF